MYSLNVVYKTRQYEVCKVDNGCYLVTNTNNNKQTTVKNVRMAKILISTCLYGDVQERNIHLRDNKGFINSVIRIVSDIETRKRFQSYLNNTYKSKSSLF